MVFNITCSTPHFFFFFIPGILLHDLVKIVQKQLTGLQDLFCHSKLLANSFGKPEVVVLPLGNKSFFKCWRKIFIGVNLFLVYCYMVGVHIEKKETCHLHIFRAIMWWWWYRSRSDKRKRNIAKPIHWETGAWHAWSISSINASTGVTD